MTEYLWSNERVEAEVDLVIRTVVYAEPIDHDAVAIAITDLLLEMRSEYGSRIVELEARLAETWEPVPEGTIPCACGECANSLTVEHYGGLTLENEAGYWTVELPDNLRLSRRTKAVLCENCQGSGTRMEWTDTIQAGVYAPYPCDCKANNSVPPPEEPTP